MGCCRLGVAGLPVLEVVVDDDDSMVISLALMPPLEVLADEGGSWRLLSADELPTTTPLLLLLPAIL